MPAHKRAEADAPSHDRLACPDHAGVSLEGPPWEQAVGTAIQGLAHRASSTSSECSRSSASSGPLTVLASGAAAPVHTKTTQPDDLILVGPEGCQAFITCAGPMGGRKARLFTPVAQSCVVMQDERPQQRLGDGHRCSFPPNPVTCLHDLSQTPSIGDVGKEIGWYRPEEALGADRTRAPPRSSIHAHEVHSALQARQLRTMHAHTKRSSPSAGQAAAPLAAGRARRPTRDADCPSPGGPHTAGSRKFRSSHT